MSFKKVVGKKATWYVTGNPKEIYVDTGDPESQGFGGAICMFTLEDGTKEQVKGPWHSNSEALFKDTGLDLRNEKKGQTS